jgi:poly(beta-D-mannuronate) lyase
MNQVMTVPRCGSLRNCVSVFKASNIWLLLSALLVLSGCRESLSSVGFDGINPPYNITTVQPATGSPAQIACARLPSRPAVDLVLGNVYKRSDPTRSEIDEEAKGTYLKQTKDLNIFQDKLSRSSNAYLKSGKKDYESAHCALDWLHAWAQEGALLGQTNVQGTYARQWALAGFASSYMQIKDYEPYDATKKQEIDRWLDTVAVKVMGDYADIAQSIGRQNNHLYWAAWAVTATGVATGKKYLYNWGVGKVKYALHTQIQPDGTLPLELIRGKKALQYHVFALAPLIMVSEVAMRNGENLYVLNNSALHNLVRRTFKGLEDPSYFEEKGKHQQIRGDTMSKGHFSWIEVYQARFPNAEMEQFLQQHRPIISPRTGGDMSYLYMP